MNSATPYAGLLPCPHCGGKPHMPYLGNRVECEDCESSVCGEDAWNRRTEAAEAISSLLNALEPFIEAAKMGVATYEAVKAANLRQQGLSIYETIYVGAGVYAAESRVSYADWSRLAALNSDAPSQMERGE